MTRSCSLLKRSRPSGTDTDDLRQVLEDANCKHNKLVVKSLEAQTTQEKRKAAQHEADMKVRGCMLEDAAVAEVWQWAACQVEKARKAAEKLHLEQEASQSPQKVWLQLGVSFLPCFHCFFQG